VVVKVDIPKKEVECRLAGEKKHWDARGKELGKVVLEAAGDGELEIRAYEKSLVPYVRIRRISY
jgi:hypothetical protein